MSHESNTLLLQWANEMAEEMTGTWLERRIHELIKDNDLEELRRVITRFSGEVAQKHFHDRDIEEVGDTY